MKVLITGADGFLGRNLAAHLGEREDIEVSSFTREDSPSRLDKLVDEVDFIFHLAGVNRPRDQQEFQQGNTDLTSALCNSVGASGKRIPVLFSSSIQATLGNPYGKSKQAAEVVLQELASRQDLKLHLFRLPNVFGKWARPDYNSVVATFCHNICRNLDIRIDDAEAKISLVYIDDVIAHFIAMMDGRENNNSFIVVEPEYSISVGDLSRQLYSFRDSRKTLVTEAVGTGLTRALYSTYLSYLPPADFTYEVPRYDDPRGVFVEMLKTHNSGQFSFFTMHPGITRGAHYHHSKTEKFLVIKGRASFRFRHIVTGEFHQLYTCGDSPEIVESVPGWSHDISNTGDDEVIVMIWANEIFNRDSPDTFAMPVVADT